jgi:hypothetical protein
MKFTPGPAIAAASGSIGGTVFSRNRYGAYTRNRAIPITVTSEAAIAAKARLAGLSADWQTLTAAQKRAWTAWAQNNPQTDALGQVQVLTGHAAYVGLNSRILLVAGTQIDVPPIVPVPEALETITLTADIGAGDFEIAYTPTPCAAGVAIAYKACVVDSPGINYVSNLLRFITVGAAAGASPLDIETAMGNRFGSFQVGQTVHVWVAQMHLASGQIGPYIRSSVLVTTT